MFYLKMYPFLDNSILFSCYYNLQILFSLKKSFYTTFYYFIRTLLISFLNKNKAKVKKPHKNKKIE